MARLTMGTDKPDEPRDADFALIIDFKKGEDSPTRVFTAAADFIHAFEALDKALVKSIDSSIEPVMMLEDVEAGSLKVWLKNALKSTDDQALKDLDWRPAVGKYLVRAKYMVLRWVDADEMPRSLQLLRQELGNLAKETDVRHLPDYSPVEPAALIDVAKQIQGGKDRLGKQDRVYIENEEGRHEINLLVRVEPDQLAELATKETITSEPALMILAVKKPDYLGSSKWELRHGRRSVSARIADEQFLSSFQGRKLDVRPGDALRCMVSIESKYGFDNELISESFVVVQVREILEDRSHQPDMFEDNAE
ncbi:hypothetical protein [Hyphomonas sp. UBA1923]|uniref:hypothetical protein n=1 Tax=Hyphomonas sp. UBA1923 TaxID=1946617 RepID=UPI0025BA644C|nr:hypothetical protein [Hyphomonas sp. UBA1923]|tara:strand:- start:214 stop:1137 length:924 start_codon:yes stop_codon:yes gene_type:complete